MEAEPHMYLGRWTEVVRVAEEGLPVAWDIGEWDVVFWMSAWLGIAYLKLQRRDDARRVVDRAMQEARARAAMRWPITFLHIAMCQVNLAFGEPAAAVDAARTALTLAEQSRSKLEEGAASRALGQAYEAEGNRSEAHAALRGSLSILEDIQSRPELAQTLLAYGRFLLTEDHEKGSQLIRRAVSLFEEIGASGWVDEARAALPAA